MGGNRGIKLIEIIDWNKTEGRNIWWERNYRN